MFGFGSFIGGALKNLIGLMFSSPRTEVAQNKAITPAYVEQLILSVGRTRVFARAKENGWSPEQSPPLWVWYQICCELIREGAVDTGLGNQPLQ